jgi:hypothetical protein
MTRTLAGADIRGYYSALGIELSRWAQAEAAVRCFADPDAHHRADRDPSCSVNLEHGAWHCHGCGAHGGAFDAATTLGHTPRTAIDLMINYGLVQRRPAAHTSASPARRRALARSLGRSVPACSRPRLGISDSDIRHWQVALADNPELIARLTRERGWLYSTMLELRLGYDCGAVTIPAHDERHNLVGLLRYRPWPKAEQPKMRAVQGSRRALLPHPAAEASKRVLLVEGEPDMIAARAHNLPAIAVPGAKAWRPEWARLFGGREVTIAMDADRDGRAGAERMARSLSTYARTLVLDLAPERDDGYDVTNWLLDGKHKELIWP